MFAAGGAVGAGPLAGAGCAVCAGRGVGRAGFGAAARRGGDAAGAASAGTAPVFAGDAEVSGIIILTGGIDAADGTLKPGGTGLAPDADAIGARRAVAVQFAACLPT